MSTSGSGAGFSFLAGAGFFAAGAGAFALGFSATGAGAVALGFSATGAGAGTSIFGSSTLGFSAFTSFTGSGAGTGAGTGAGGALPLVIWMYSSSVQSANLLRVISLSLSSA